MPTKTDGIIKIVIMPNLEHLIIRKSKMKCSAMGCNHFSCGSIGHNKDCVLYPDSMQSMIDDKNERIKELEKNMCIYAREEMRGIDFGSDKDVIEYFSDFAANHE